MNCWTTRLRRTAAGLAAGLAFGALAAAPALAETKLKMVLNWKYQGPQAMFFLAQDNGYFKAEGLDVTIDQGNGSGAAVPLVAKKPEDAPIGVYMLFNQPPFTVAVKADGPLKTPQDLVGKTLGGAANDGALKLFPAFCKQARIDCTGITITNMQPSLREQMLMQGQVDGVFGYVNTIRFSAKLIGVDDDKIRYINYGDYGMDLYSNAIIVSAKLAKENPQAVKGLVRALNKGLKDMIKDPKAGVAAVLKREPLIKPQVELERLEATVRAEMNHPEIASIGLGAIDPARMKQAIDILVEANKLPTTPKVEQIFTPAFLPPLEDRLTKLF